MAKILFINLRHALKNSLLAYHWQYFLRESWESQVENITFSKKSPTGTYGCALRSDPNIPMPDPTLWTDRDRLSQSMSQRGHRGQPDASVADLLHGIPMPSS